MALKRIPKTGDHVLTTEDCGTFIVLGVDVKHGTVNLRPLGQPDIVCEVEWETLTFLNK